MNDWHQRYAAAVAAALALHAAAATALYLADTEPLPTLWQDPTEVSVVQPPPPAVIPQPPPEPPPEPVVEPKPVPKKVEPRKIARKAPESAPRPTSETEIEPAPGPAAPESPGAVYRIGDLAPSGAVKTSVGTGDAKGTRGTGTGDGGGGPPESKGSGPPKPVSIASIKQKAMPIGNTGFANLGKDYPPEALKRKISGDVKVRLVVDDQGRVTSRKIVKGLGFGLNERALRLSRRLRFKPAIDTSDRPVASIVVWTFTFELPR